MIPNISPANFMKTNEKLFGCVTRALVIDVLLYVYVCAICYVTTSAIATTAAVDVVDVVLNCMQ